MFKQEFDPYWDKEEGYTSGKWEDHYAHVQVVIDGLKRFKQEIIEQFQQLQPTGEELMAFSLTKAIGKSGGKSGAGSFAPLMKATTLKKKGDKLTFKVKAIREAPTGWNAVAVLDFEPVMGVGAFALNKTNAGILSAECGDDVIGRKITVQRDLVEFGGNPIPGLKIVKVSK